MHFRTYKCICMLKTTKCLRNKRTLKEIDKYTMFMDLKRQHSKDVSYSQVDIQVYAILILKKNTNKFFVGIQLYEFILKVYGKAYVLEQLKQLKNKWKD